MLTAEEIESAEVVDVAEEIEPPRSPWADLTEPADGWEPELSSLLGCPGAHGARRLAAEHGLSGEGSSSSGMSAESRRSDTAEPAENCRPIDRNSISRLKPFSMVQFENFLVRVARLFI